MFSTFAVTRFVERYLLNSCKNEVNMNVQWYPGHMTKAKRQMQEDIKLIDLIIELVDSRVPLASRNPDIDELGKNKARLILLNKSDLVDERQNEAWKAYFQGKGFYVVKVDSRSGSGMKAIQAAIQEACREKTERDRRRGIKNRPIRAMVVGIPNVGKSTFINTFAGRACAKTGNKPGVTKGKQWIRLNKNVELLDTPGILWPKFEDEAVGMRLAYIGSIKDDILNMEELSLTLIDFLREKYSGASAFFASNRVGIVIFLNTKLLFQEERLSERTKKILVSVGGCVFGCYLLGGFIGTGGRLDVIAGTLTPVTGMLPAYIIEIIIAFLIEVAVTLVLKKLPVFRKLL